MENTRIVVDSAAFSVGDEYQWLAQSDADLAQAQAQLSVSRAAYAAVVGQTPADYLSDWRVALAQTRLRAAQPVKAMAEELGCAHPSALSRAFGARVGMSPRQWLAQVSAGDAPR